MQTSWCEWGMERRHHRNKTKGCLPQDSDEGTKIAGESWQRTSTASHWPACFKPPVQGIITGASLHCHPASVSAPKTFWYLQLKKSWCVFQFDTAYCRWKEICTQQKLMRRWRKQCTEIFSVFSRFDKDTGRNPHMFTMHTNCNRDFIPLYSLSVSGLNRRSKTRAVAITPCGSLECIMTITCIEAEMCTLNDNSLNECLTFVFLCLLYAHKKC